MKANLKLKVLFLATMITVLTLPLLGCLPSQEEPKQDSNQKAPAVDVSKYPERNVEAINQFGPGGGTDVFIRAIAVPFSNLSKQSLVPISITGGGGVPAYTEFVNRPADGYTLMAIGPEEVINHAMKRIDATKLAPLARIQYDQGLLFVSSESPYKSVEDLIKYAKENPEKLSVGITGAAGFDETLIGLWNLRTGAKLKAVPFDGSAETSAALLGGHINVMYEEYGPMQSLIQSGKVRPLVLFSEERLPAIKDVPTAKELGYDITLGRWRGFAMKQGSSPEQANALFKIFEQGVKDSDYKNYEEKNMLHFRSKLLGPDEFKTFFDKEIQTYTEVLKELGYVK